MKKKYSSERLSPIETEMSAEVSDFFRYGYVNVQNLLKNLILSKLKKDFEKMEPPGIFTSDVLFFK